MPEKALPSHDGKILPGCYPTQPVPSLGESGGGGRALPRKQHPGHYPPLTSSELTLTGVLLSCTEQRSRLKTRLGRVSISTTHTDTTQAPRPCGPKSLTEYCT